MLFGNPTVSTSGYKNSNLRIKLVETALHIDWINIQIFTNKIRTSSDIVLTYILLQEQLLAFFIIVLVFGCSVTYLLYPKLLAAPPVPEIFKQFPFYSTDDPPLATIREMA